MKILLLVLSVAVSALNLPAMAQATELISEVVTVKYAKASIVANTLNRLSRESQSSGNGRASGTASANTVQITGTPKILADDRSNSLVILATRSDLFTLKAVVAKLDAPSKEILIEAILLERYSPNGPADHAARSDVRWATSFTAAGGTSDGFNYAVVLSNDFKTVVASLVHDGGTNILVIQEPRAVTTDGEAVIISILRPIISATPPPLHPVSPELLRSLRTGPGLSVTPVTTADGQIVMLITGTLDEAAGKTSVAGVGNAPDSATARSEAAAALQKGETLMVGGAASPPELHPGRRGGEIIVLLRAVAVPDPAK